MRLLLRAVPLIVAGCTTSVERPTTVSTSPPPNTGPNALSQRANAQNVRRAPVEVRVWGPEHVAGGSDVTLRIAIDKATRDPLDLHVALPPGAELVAGATDERISDPSGHIERTLVVRMPNGVPADDLNVTVDSQGAASGVHTAAAYRFGRPEPTLAQPPRPGVPAIVEGKTLGTPIPLK